MKKEYTVLTICNHETALEMIKQSIANKYIFICAKKIKQSQLPKGYIVGKNVISYSHLSLKRGKYFPKMDWTKVLPLDGDLINRMALCQIETMRMVERIPCIRKTYETRFKYYYDNLRYWSHILTSQKVDFFYRCAPPHEGYDNVISHLCDIYKIPALYFNPFHPQKFYFARFVNDQFPYIESEYNVNLALLEKQNKNGLVDEIKPFKDCPILTKFFEDHINLRKPTAKPVVIPAKKRKTQRTLLKRNSAMLKYYETKATIPEIRKLKGKYIYVPLHYQYEATTCPMGGPYVDQILMIEILSRLGIQIYVKEHPRVSKNRNMDYYIKIASLRNVKLIPIKTDNYDLIDNSLCVASVTGTAGWEAILRGKQALVFGNIFHGYAPGGYFVKSLDDCNHAIKAIHDFKFDKNKLAVFLYTLEKYLFNHNVVDIVKALKEEFEIIKQLLLSDCDCCEAKDYYPGVINKIVGDMEESEDCDV